MYKARKLIHEAGISNADVEGSIAVAEDKLNKAQEEVSKKRSYPELLWLVRLIANTVRQSWKFYLI